MYSQNNEEELASKYFWDRKITCLSIGENNGEILSNVRQAIINGASALLVEPAPKAFNELQVLYSEREDVVCVNVAVSNFNGKSMLFDSGTHLNKGDTSLLSSLIKSEIKKWEPTTDFTEVEVHVVDFEKLLMLSPYKTFEMISIDAEGNDLTILEQMNLKELGCEFLIVEFNGKDKEKFDNLVLPQGLRLIHQNAENLLYAK